jgi:hypothetical protein
MAPATTGSAALTVPDPLAHFEGVGSGFPTAVGGTYSLGGAPADPDGAVGPHHYVAMVNTAFAVFDKSGSVLAGATDTNALFSSLNGTSAGGTKCATENQGDGIVLYDRLADRWFLTQFAFSVDASGNPTAPFFQCVAVSATPDPTGQYDVYVFGPYTFSTTGTAGALNDYAKFGVWPDAYYMTANMFGATGSFLGAKVCALERAAMLAGQPARQQCFDIPGNGGLLPADLDGKRPPPDGAPAYVVTFDNTTSSILQVWRVRIDWNTTANSTLLPGASTPMTIPVGTIVLGCGNTPNDTCVPQPSTTTQLDALGDRLMHRLAYRNHGDHESLVVTHTVQVADAASGTRAGLRWYELQQAPPTASATSPLTLAQQGTFSPDATFRWMGSAAQDQLGDLAIGFSASSATIFPSLRYTGRLWNDAAGAMGPGEGTLFQGTGSQTARPGATRTAAPIPDTRWGDYSALAVDPSDDCTFWYTNEYVADTVLPSGPPNWHTRIGRFRLPACPPAFAVTLPAVAETGQTVNVSAAAVDALGTPLASYGGTATVTSDDPLATLPATVTFAAGHATFPVTFGSVGAHGVIVTDDAGTSFTGSGATVVGAPGGGPAAFHLAAPASAVAGTPVTVTVSAVDAFGNLATGYAGSATLASSDPSAVLPTSSAFAGGVATVTVTFGTAGTQTVTAADAASPSIHGSATVVVSAPPAETTPQPKTPSGGGGGGGGCSSGAGAGWAAVVLAVLAAVRPRRWRAALLLAASLAACAGSGPRPLRDGGTTSEPSMPAVSPPVRELPPAPAPPRADHRPGPVRSPNDGGTPDGGSSAQ